MVLFGRALNHMYQEMSKQGSDSQYHQVIFHPHLGADSDEPTRHGVHEVILLSKERHNPTVDWLAGQLACKWRVGST